MKFLSAYILLLIFLATLGRGVARVDFGTNFIKSFILNEQKPTFVIFCDVCWNIYKKVNLANEILRTGGRVSSSLEKGLKYQDHDLLFLLDLDCPNADEVIELYHFGITIDMMVKHGTNVENSIFRHFCKRHDHEELRMLQASSMNLFRSPYRWLILTNSTEEAKLETLWNSPLLPDSDVVLVERKNDEYLMVELHKPSHNHSMVSTPRGSYNGTLRDTRPRRELYRRRFDLMGHPLTMANVIQDSNSTKNHLEDGLEFQNDAIAKISWMNAKLAFLMLNATPNYIFSYRWGYKVNGQWSGMINDLHSGRADIGTNCVVSNTERLSVVAYTDTLAPFRVRFIFRQPPLTYVANIYSLPFSSNLWVGTAVCAVVSAAAIYVAARWELSFGREKSQLSGGISDALLLTMSALSQQGCDMEPRRTPGRIMEWTMFTALMALYAAYSANIVVLLQAPSNSIRTLPQLAYSKITLAANDVDYNYFVFKQYKDPVHVAIYKRVDPPKGHKQFYDITEGVERIRQGLFAFHSIAEPVYRRIEETFLESEKCDLMEIDYLNSFEPYVPMKKDSPYMELVRVAFKRLRETGVQSALNRRHQVPKPHCANKAAAFSSVGVLDLKSVMYLMVIGFVTSVLILVMEIAVFNVKQNMLKRSMEKTKASQFQMTNVWDDY